MEALDAKIEKAQAQVSKTKKQYDAVVAALSDLLDNRDALRRDELVKAIISGSEHHHSNSSQSTSPISFDRYSSYVFRSKRPWFSVYS